MKTQGIHGNYFGEQHSLHLKRQLFEVIRHDESSAFRRMGVHVEIVFQITRFILLHNYFLGGVDGRLEAWARRGIESVQILIPNVESPESPGDSIWIDQRDDFEDVEVSNDLGLGVYRINKEIYEAV